MNTGLVEPTFPNVLDSIFRDARMTMALANLDADTAITFASKPYIDAGEMAEKRIGPFAANLTDEERADYLAYGEVGRAVRDNEYHETVGNCREYIFAKLT